VTDPLAAIEHQGVTVATGRRESLALAALLVALSAMGGAIGLVSGALSTGGDLESRLPFDSPVLAGVALAAVVAVPFTALAVAAWRASRWTDLLACTAGVLLLGWLLFEVMVIRELSLFQPIYGAVAVAFVWAGRAALPISRR